MIHMTSSTSKNEDKKRQTKFDTLGLKNLVYSVNPISGWTNFLINLIQYHLGFRFLLRFWMTIFLKIFEKGR